MISFCSDVYARVYMSKAPGPPCVPAEAATFDENEPWVSRKSLIVGSSACARRWASASISEVRRSTILLPNRTRSRSPIPNDYPP